MKKAFLVILDYEENTEYMFTDIGVEVAFDNQLFELEERGHVSSYENTEAYELNEETVKQIMKDIE